MSKGYEQSDAKPRTLALAGIGLALITGVGLAGSYLIASGLQKGGEETRTHRHPMADFREGPAGPLLQAQPSDEWTTHSAWENQALHSYEWLDADRGIVRIPIERAMRFVVEEQKK